MFSEAEKAEGIITILFMLPVLIMGGLMVHRLFDMFLDHELSLPEFLVFVIGFVALLAGGIACWRRPMLVAVFAVAAFLLAVTPSLLLFLVNHFGLQRLRWSDYQEHLQAAEKHPDIPYHYRKLAEMFYKDREWALAAEFYQRALAIKEDRQAAFYLERARTQAGARGKGSPDCASCARPLGKGMKQCLFCGAPAPSGMKLPAVTAERRLPLLWGGGLALVVGLVLGWATTLPGVLWGALLLVGVALLGMHMYQVVRAR